MRVYELEARYDARASFYGKPIKEIPLKEAVKIFNYATAVYDYRRYEPCASLLRGFDPSLWDDLVVLSYGY